MTSPKWTRSERDLATTEERFIVACTHRLHGCTPVCGRNRFFPQHLDDGTLSKCLQFGSASRKTWTHSPRFRRLHFVQFESLFHSLSLELLLSSLLFLVTAPSGDRKRERERVVTLFACVQQTAAHRSMPIGSQFPHTAVNATLLVCYASGAHGRPHKNYPRNGCPPCAASEATLASDYSAVRCILLNNSFHFPPTAFPYQVHSLSLHALPSRRIPSPEIN